MAECHEHQLAALLKHCAQERDLDAGRRAHAQIIQRGSSSNVGRYLGNLLVNMYGKCGCWEEARRVFNDIDNKSDATSWTIMLRAYAQNGHNEMALQLYLEMHLEGIKPDAFSFSTLITACANTFAFAQGSVLHSHAHEAGNLDECDLVVGNSLIGLYAKCREMDEAWQVFQKMHERDVIAWNAMITGYAQVGHYKVALHFFYSMLQEGLDPDGSTFVRALGICSSLKDLSSGKRIHGYIVEVGYISNTRVANSVINMYGKCGSLIDAERVLNNMQSRSVVSWNAIITAYAQKGQGRRALDLFNRMDVEPNYVTFVSLLTACIKLDDMKEGKRIHQCLAALGLEKQVVVGNCLINMYGKSGLLRDAKAAFLEIEAKDEISWNALIAAYAQHGQGKKALELYRRMNLEGIKQDLNTLTSALDACTMEEDLQLGEQIHCRIKELKALEGGDDDVVTTALITFYGRCGALEKAVNIFRGVRSRDVVTWNSMIGVYAQRGCTNEALELFCKLGLEGISPDDTTFIILFCTCSHAGLFDSGWDYFTSLSTDYGMNPTPEHYRCIVDLLGRAGHLAKAEQMVRDMPETNTRLGWMTLLSACKMQDNVNYGFRAAEKIMQLPNTNESSSAYIVLSNIFSQQERQQRQLPR